MPKRSGPSALAEPAVGEGVVPPRLVVARVAPPPLTMVVGIDPGDTHCGIAVARVTYDAATQQGRVELTRAEEHLPDNCADLLASWLLEGWVDAVALERFNLDPSKALVQSGSSMDTSQLIGVLTYITRLANRGRRDAGRPEIVLSMQGREIKKSIRAQAKARGIDLIPASADHPRDAQLHAIYYAGKEVLRWGT